MKTEKKRETEEKNNWSLQNYREGFAKAEKRGRNVLSSYCGELKLSICFAKLQNKRALHSFTAIKKVAEAAKGLQNDL